MARWPTAERLACPSREPPAPQPGRSSPDCLPLGHRDPQGLHTSTLPGMPLTSTDVSSSAPISFRTAHTELFHYTDDSAPRLTARHPPLAPGRVVASWEAPGDPGRETHLHWCEKSRQVWSFLTEGLVGDRRIVLRERCKHICRSNYDKSNNVCGTLCRRNSVTCSAGCCDADRDSANGFRHPPRAPFPFFQIGYIPPGKPPHQLLMLHTRWPSVRPRPTSPRPAATPKTRHTPHSMWQN